MKARFLIAGLLISNFGAAIAADLFSPQGRGGDGSSVRLARLEKRFDEALERLEKNDSEKKPSGSGLSLPPPPGGKVIPGQLLEEPPKPIVDERIIGVVNGYEIFVRDGQVKRRERSGTSQ
ncbi:hypothetical protein [Acidovorax sp. sic0104]|uniref:hypothetical protein n=1 Tax=Acidovorax sp. sic0104 TaxID=2854784 RepID=UPI001C450FDC|nr:hypothetical protein [Acidovorax sp. sic0104]MBV7542132.1 hypothetical protein [Acidovorax sp. sic0104]